MDMRERQIYIAHTLYFFAFHNKPRHRELPMQSTGFLSDAFGSR